METCSVFSKPPVNLLLYFHNKKNKNKNKDKIKQCADSLTI